MADLLKALGGLIVMGAPIYGAARFIGLGTMRCGRPIPPWNAYCYRSDCEPRAEVAR